MLFFKYFTIGHQISRLTVMVKILLRDKQQLVDKD